MRENGISYELQRCYRASQWLTSIGNGVMIRTGDKPNIYGALWSLNKQLGKHFYVGALSVMELMGYAHYVPMGRPCLVVCSPQGEWFPAWLDKIDWGIDVVKISSGYFASEVGMSTITAESFEVPAASLERAFMECLTLAPQHYGLMDTYYVMENLTSLRPAVVQELLEKSTSVKMKRLFLYMAEKANHAWLKHLDVSKISLGSGKRAIVKSGIYNQKYQIVIPEELTAI
ncbi:hypothetical protein AGMMS4956_17630 [Bacteroidia bacterium]|nr:hypothetical protein AGMMS4956_17630 [Bacteroidia bacterium]